MLEILKSKWNDILDNIKQEYDISDVSFETWLKPLTLYSVNNNTVTIVVEESIGVSYINKRFYKLFKVTITEFLGEEYEIEFVSPDSLPDANINSSPAPVNNNIEDSNLKSRIAEANLNSKYTFDTFVVGGSNNFAHAYALKVAEAPGEIVNPLFLYGGVGLGLTHLMQSFANYILQHNLNA